MRKVFYVFKKKGLHVMALACLIAANSPMQATEKVPLEEIRHAVRVLKDIDTDQTKQWAICLLRDAAEGDTLAYAMNTLGLAYMAGAGVEKDSVQAVSWLKRAATNGFSDAYHNLGMMYKDGSCGIRQDFCKAYGLFMNGAEKGSTVCEYDAGFMLYKGLGCQQDYTKSVELFSKAAEADHSPSLYMLGLCYRNGYGVEQDTARATALLKRAALLSFGPAMEELWRPEPENYLHEEYVANDTCGCIPAEMPEISPLVNDTSLIYGHYQGFIVMYDWSGRFVLGEKPVTMDFYRKEGGKVSGTMILGNETVPFAASMTGDGRLHFSEGRLLLNERYNSEKVNYRMDNATLDLWQDKIRGRLNLYSLKLKEPERPMYLELYTGKNNETAKPVDERFNHISATPNPFDRDFDAAFELSESCQPQVRIFDQSGRLVFNQSLGTLLAGRQIVQISPVIKNGTYVLNIKAGRQVLRAIIVKNGGTQ